LSLKEEFLELLEKDREFRYAVAGLIGLQEILIRLDRHEEELVKLREDMNRLREDMNRGFARHDKIFEKHWNEIKKLREDMNRGFELLKRHIDALGARWGIMSEEAFREGIKGLIEREFGYRVEKWVKYDKEGYVFGYPSQVEIDVAIHDDKIILIEIKSYVRASDAYIFKRKSELYEKIEGKKPDKLIIITPYIEDKAVEIASRSNIEVYTKI